MARIVDWPARMAEVAKFVGLGPAELEMLRATASIVLKHADELTADVYDQFLKFPDSRRKQFFSRKLKIPMVDNYCCIVNVFTYKLCVTFFILT